MNVTLTKAEIDLVIRSLNAVQKSADSDSLDKVLADNSLNIHLIKTRLEWLLQRGEK